MSSLPFFGRSKGYATFETQNRPRGRFVIDLKSNLTVGALVPTPDSRGRLVNRIILSIWDARPTQEGRIATAFLGDGFRTADELFAEGWSAERLLLLGEAKHSPTEDGPGMWSDSQVAATKRTKAFRELQSKKQ
ncbi:hypothetical protein [Glutamicibacter sp. NPDC087344]|uniref:hypothetical protein n=1 Tax=Glutamicibacter sp. NPDC087344 TaxID=3363994 RepID=UPI0037FB52ED